MIWIAEAACSLENGVTGEEKNEMGPPGSKSLSFVPHICVRYSYWNNICILSGPLIGCLLLNEQQRTSFFRIDFFFYSLRLVSRGKLLSSTKISFIHCNKGFSRVDQKKNSGHYNVLWKKESSLDKKTPSFIKMVESIDNWNGICFHRRPFSAGKIGINLLRCKHDNFFCSHHSFAIRSAVLQTSGSPCVIYSSSSRCQYL